MNQSHNIFSEILPQAYAEVSALARLAAENMIARLQLVTIQPKVILDLGSGTGYGSELLKQAYPDAQVIAVDNVASMLSYAMSSQSGIESICAEAQSLPLPDHSVDFIFANFLLPWCQDWESLFHECRRVLREDGLLMFSCLGPDTLRELQGSYLIVKDMHEIGDALVHAKFSDPVMDTEYLTLTYREYEKMRYEMQMNGMADLPAEINTKADKFSLTFEVVYGHTWGPGPILEYGADDAGVVKIPLSHLRRNLPDKSH